MISLTDIILIYFVDFRVLKVVDRRKIITPFGTKFFIRRDLNADVALFFCSFLGTQN